MELCIMCFVVVVVLVHANWVFCTVTIFFLSYKLNDVLDNQTKHANDIMHTAHTSSYIYTKKWKLTAEMKSACIKCRVAF